MSVKLRDSLQRCDTLMLDMDGTLLDLAYDNYVWLQAVPEAYAQRHALSETEARERLYATMRRLRGTLDWYCLDHWSDALELDIVALHRNLDHRIDFLPGAREFLQQIAKRDIRLLLVTNSHTATLNIKDAVTGIAGYFDEVYTSHSLGHAKEDQSFWRELAGRERFDPSKTMFVDDNVEVLQSARMFGLEKLVAVTSPDTTAPVKDVSTYDCVEGVADLLVNERR